MLESTGARSGFIRSGSRVRMEPDGLLSGDQIDALSTVYIVLLTPSVIGSFSVLVVSIVRWRHLKEQGHLLVQLALADLLAALVLMFSSVMNKVPTKNSGLICQYSLPLSLIFYFISFLLVVVYAWKSKNVIQGWRDSPADDEGGQNIGRRRVVAINVYAILWLVPLALYFAYMLTHFIKPSPLSPATNSSVNEVIHSNSTYCTRCILFLHFWRDSCSVGNSFHDIFIRVSLFIVVIPVMLCCSVIYYKIGKWYERRGQEGLFPVEGDGRSRRRIKTGLSTARNMVIVILICWAPALFLILLSSLLMQTNVKQHSLFGLYMIQAASLSLQGFLNSMVYAWKRPNFTDAVLGENTPLVAYDRLAFFDESLRTSF